MDEDRTITFLINWAINSLAILIFSAISGKYVDLGNTKIPGSMVAVLSALVFTLVINFMPRILENTEFKVKDERLKAILPSFIVLIPIIWVYKSLSFVTAFGVLNNVFVIILALILPTLQYFDTKICSKYLKKI